MALDLPAVGAHHRRQSGVVLQMLRVKKQALLSGDDEAPGPPAWGGRASLDFGRATQAPGTAKPGRRASCRREAGRILFPPVFSFQIPGIASLDSNQERRTAMTAEGQPTEGENPGDVAAPETSAGGEDLCSTCGGSGRVKDEDCDTCEAVARW